MKSIPILIVALLIAIVVPSVCAEDDRIYVDPELYSQEYYNFTHNADIIFNKFASGGDLSGTGNWVWGNNYYFQQMESQRGRAIQIAIEKNNELLQEQNDLLRNLTTMKYQCDARGGLLFDCRPVIV